MNRKSDIIVSESEGNIMPKLYNVEISDNAWYPEIEADTPEEAIQVALEWWLERQPDIHCEETQEDD